MHEFLIPPSRMHVKNTKGKVIYRVFFQSYYYRSRISLNVSMWLVGRAELARNDNITSLSFCKTLAIVLFEFLKFVERNLKHSRHHMALVIFNRQNNILYTDCSYIFFSQ
jgi:hypothetical protein